MAAGSDRKAYVFFAEHDGKRFVVMHYGTGMMDEMLPHASGHMRGYDVTQMGQAMMMAAVCDYLGTPIL